MFVFKILLIILIALPVIALAWFFYSQMLSFIMEKNAQEDERIRQSVLEESAQNGGKAKRRGRRR